MKTYRKPKAKIVNINGHVILAGSDPTPEPTSLNGYDKGDGLAKRSIFDYGE